MFYEIVFQNFHSELFYFTFVMIWTHFLEFCFVFIYNLKREAVDVIRKMNEWIYTNGIIFLYVINIFGNVFYESAIGKYSSIMICAMHRLVFTFDSINLLFYPAYKLLKSAPAHTLIVINVLICRPKGIINDGSSTVETKIVYNVTVFPLHYLQIFKIT